MKTTTTSQPSDPVISFDQPNRQLTKSERAALSSDLMNGINAGIAARGALEANLRDWRALYEMEPPATQDQPWVDASNITLPVIPSQIDSTLAYAIARTLVPRFFIVTGNTPDAQQYAYQVERYYAAELARQRGRTTWYEALVRWMQLGLIDGTGYLEATWRRTKTKRRIAEMQPVVVDGVPVIDPETGRPRQERQVREVEMTSYDDVQWTPRQLKDVILMPGTASSTEDAAAVAVVEWLYESDLKALIADAKERGTGEFYEDSIERALSYVDDGTSDDIASDRQGSYDKTEGGQVQPGSAQGSHTSKFFRNRGPVKVFRIHSRQFDLDGDDECEENIFYYHDRTQEMLGWMPYEYLVQERCIFEWAPYPRPTEALGFSLVQRLAPISAEISKIFNDRNNAVDIALSPPRIRKSGVQLYDNDNQYGPGVEWEGEENSVTFLKTADIPTAAFQQEADLKQWAAELTGQNQPAMGAQSSGRRTATENRIQAAATGTRNDLIVMRFRIPCRALINFTHRLKLQYLQDDQQVSDSAGTFTLPREVLAQDYRIDISGASDPLDAATRLNQDMGIFQMLAQDQMIMSDPVKHYYLLRKILEDAGTSNIEQIIGTAEEAAQMKQAMQQAAQQQQAQGGAPGQQPGQQPHPPQHGGPPK